MNGAGNTFLFHDSRNHKLNINNDLIFKLQSAVMDYRFDQFISIEMHQEMVTVRLNFGMLMELNQVCVEMPLDVSVILY